MKSRTLSRREWDEYVAGCDGATFFHTYDWYAIWEAYEQRKSKALFFTFPSGNTAMLPLSERRIHKGITRIYDSSPAGTYGGFLSKMLLSSKEVLELLAFVKKMTISIVFNPYQPLDGLEKMEKGFTQLININNGVNKNKWHKYKYSMNKAKKNGLEVCRGVTMEEWMEYYDLYEKSLARWGDRVSSRYGVNLFVLFKDLGGEKCQLWLVCKDGKPIYGAVYFLFGEVLTQWHAAGDKDFFVYRPATFLHSHLIDYAKENSFNYYDFNPSGGHAGVENFKNNFRPEKVFFPVLSSQSKRHSVLDSFSRIIRKKEL